MGYADIGEEEDWERTDQKSPKEAGGHATSKKRKDGSAAGLALTAHPHVSAVSLLLGHLPHCSARQAFLVADQRGSKRKSTEPDAKARQRLQGMFKRAPVRTAPRSTATDQSSEDLLSDILGSIGGAAG